MAVTLEWTADFWTLVSVGIVSVTWAIASVAFGYWLGNRRGFRDGLDAGTDIGRTLEADDNLRTDDIRTFRHRLERQDMDSGTLTQLPEWATADGRLPDWWHGSPDDVDFRLDLDCE